MAWPLLKSLKLAVGKASGKEIPPPLHQIINDYQNQTLFCVKNGNSKTRVKY